GFTDGQWPVQGQKKVATLINCVYNTHQFWDGRVAALERVVQRTLEDEREPEKLADNKRQIEADQQRQTEAERKHIWSGVVKRLRDNNDYVRRFRKVFGTLPTQDSIGKALATYLRTVLCGRSVYDFALDASQGKVPQDKHYLEYLNDSDLK